MFPSRKNIPENPSNPQTQTQTRERGKVGSNSSSRASSSLSSSPSALFNHRLPFTHDRERGEEKRGCSHDFPNRRKEKRGRFERNDTHALFDAGKGRKWSKKGFPPLFLPSTQAIASGLGVRRSFAWTSAASVYSCMKRGEGNIYNLWEVTVSVSPQARKAHPFLFVCRKGVAERKGTSLFSFL